MVQPLYPQLRKCPIRPQRGRDRNIHPHHPMSSAVTGASSSVGLPLHSLDGGESDRADGPHCLRSHGALMKRLQVNRSFPLDLRRSFPLGAHYILRRLIAFSRLHHFSSSTSLGARDPSTALGSNWIYSKLRFFFMNINFGWCRKVLSAGHPRHIITIFRPSPACPCTSISEESCGMTCIPQPSGLPTGPPGGLRGLRGDLLRQGPVIVRESLSKQRGPPLFADPRPALPRAAILTDRGPS